MNHDEQEKMVRRAADDEGARDELAEKVQAESMDSYYVEHEEERPWMPTATFYIGKHRR